MEMNRQLENWKNVGLTTSAAANTYSLNEQI
jgi:hypothetical protein